MPPKRKAALKAGSKKYGEQSDDEYYDGPEYENDDFIDDSEYNMPNKKEKINSGKGKNVKSFQNATNRQSSSLNFMESSVICQDYSSTLTLKPDHKNRPIWITKDNTIMLEAFSPCYKSAYDFLIDIAEPETRPEFIHTYRLTEDSLYAAVALALDTEKIIRQLNILCKTEIPIEVEKYIRDCTYTFGKAKLVLKDNNYCIESKSPDILRDLLRNPKILAARIFDIIPTTSNITKSTSIVNLTNTNKTNDEFIESTSKVEDKRNITTNIDLEDIDDDIDEDNDLASNTLKTVSFYISSNKVQLVKKAAKEESHYPLLEEYDYECDLKNPKLNISLRPSTQIRHYQERSLNKMFGNGRARSGIIVLPCGAGKSLTGVTAATTIKRSVVVMCINNQSVKQWKEQFLTWTTLPEKCIKILSRDTKDTLPPLNEACVLITNYAMLTHGGKRSESAEVIINAVKKREWGLLILDEVHVAPAEQFQKVLDIVNAHCKLGLTATLVREDNKIKNLSFLVGPKLYEANWIDLTNQGFLARAQCVEVWCPMTKEFFRQYIECGLGSHSRTQQLLYILNPRKFRSCEYLVKHHSARGDKIIIFSDDVPALKMYCTALKTANNGDGIPYIYGDTKEEERRKWLMTFKDPLSKLNVIGLSQVGDTALDIPEANVVIQVSSHYGARRQEAQRLGRILRPKPNPTGGFNAFFYTLVSTDTKEMFFSTKRQQYLIDQGYTFKVEQYLVDEADKQSECLTSKTMELNLLNKILQYNMEELRREDGAEKSVIESEEAGENDEYNGDISVSYKTINSNSSVQRRLGSMSSLSGADGSIYVEFDSNK